MSRMLSHGDRRTLAIGALAIGTLVAGARGAPAWLAWRSRLADEAARAATMLADAQDAARSAGAVRAALDSARRASSRLDSMLIAGASPNDAEARLAAALDSMATDAHVRIDAMQLGGDSAATDALVRVSARLTGVGDVRGVLRLLAAIEGDHAPMVLTELSVTAADARASDALPEVLRFDVMVRSIAAVAAGTAS